MTADLWLKTCRITEIFRGYGKTEVPEEQVIFRKRALHTQIVTGKAATPPSPRAPQVEKY